MTFDELRDKAHALPLKPGVYIMQNAASEVIYVGKAKALKNRVSQYFQDQSRHNEKTRAMVSQIDHFDVIVVQSEFEALVLECALIKRHQPRYNILLKDSKGFPYIRLSPGNTPGSPWSPRRRTTEPGTLGLMGAGGPARASSTPCGRPCACPPAAGNSPGTLGRSGPASTSTWACATATAV